VEYTGGYVSEWHFNGLLTKLSNWVKCDNGVHICFCTNFFSMLCVALQAVTGCEHALSAIDYSTTNNINTMNIHSRHSFSKLK
jgi:hypothetical protein